MEGENVRKPIVLEDFVNTNNVNPVDIGRLIIVILSCILISYLINLLARIVMAVVVPGLIALLAYKMYQSVTTTDIVKCLEPGWNLINSICDKFYEIIYAAISH